MAQKGMIFTGARARFSIGGKRVGYARNVSVSEEISYEPVEVLGNVEVSEFTATGYRVTFTAGFFRIIGDTVKSQGWFPMNGGNSDEHLTNILAIDDGPPLTAMIEDSKTGKTVALLTQVKVASHNWAVDARGIVGEDCQFNAIRISDEAEQ
jgi:hypothetical protein